MANMYVHARVCIWIIGFNKLEALGALMGFPSFFFLSLCLFDAIIDLHAMDREAFNESNFLGNIGSVNS